MTCDNTPTDNGEAILSPWVSEHIPLILIGPPSTRDISVHRLKTTLQRYLLLAIVYGTHFKWQIGRSILQAALNVISKSLSNVLFLSNWTVSVPFDSAQGTQGSGRTSCGRWMSEVEANVNVVSQVRIRFKFNTNPGNTSSPDSSTGFVNTSVFLPER